MCWFIIFRRVKCFNDLGPGSYFIPYQFLLQTEYQLFDVPCINYVDVYSLLKRATNIILVEVIPLCLK